MEELEQLKSDGEAPEWLTEAGFLSLSRGYLLPGETPRKAYQRVSGAIAVELVESLPFTDDYQYNDRYNFLKSKFFQYMWKGWLGLASPIFSNVGTDRGLPISCVTGDMWINTPSGGQLMKDIEVGDKVLTHEGRFKEVTNKIERLSSGDLYELRLNTRTSPIKITGNHPVLTNLGWVRVDELDSDRHLVASNWEVDFEEENYKIDFTKYLDMSRFEIRGELITKISENKQESKRVKVDTVDYWSKPYATVEVDKDLAWALGYWFAEGSLSKSKRSIANGLRVTAGLDQRHLAEKWRVIMEEKFNVNGGTYESSRVNTRDPSKTDRWVNSNVNSVIIGEWFLKEFGPDCKTKTIPEWIIALPIPILEEFLRGFLIGDGSIGKGYKARKKVDYKEGISVTVSNPQLCLGIYNIALKLNKPVSLQMYAKGGELSTTKFVNSIRFLKNYELGFSASRNTVVVPFGKLLFCRIKKLEKLNYDEPVYDITVEDDHSFSVCGVVVHNCFSNHVPDSIDGIFTKVHELACLSKNGGGVGVYMGDVRGRGAPICSGLNGESEGVIPWTKVIDSTTLSVSQGGVRRGATAVYLPMSHPDIEDFLRMRRPSGDVNRQCLNIHHGVCIDDEFMRSLEQGNLRNRRLWQEVLKTRAETGEPYIFFTDNVNRQNPECYQERGLSVYTSNICTEITGYTDPNHTFVCCLSSLNLSKWEEWKDTDLVYDAIWFLDGVITHFIKKAKELPGMEASIRFAEKGRMVGLGAFGFHTLLQQKKYAFDSLSALLINKQIFKHIRREADRATKDLAAIYGEPDWCEGSGRRNTHCLAVAPTVTNSKIVGYVSPSIEPWSANVFADKTAKGTFIIKNKELEKDLEDLGLNTPKVWQDIAVNHGSIQHLDVPDELKKVYKTAREINQFAIVGLAADRQEYIDQAQSINLFFSQDASPKYIHEVHFSAWEKGIKSLYYYRTSSILIGDVGSREYNRADCLACEG